MSKFRRSYATTDEHYNKSKISIFIKKNSYDSMPMLYLFVKYRKYLNNIK